MNICVFFKFPFFIHLCKGGGWLPGEIAKNLHGFAYVFCLFFDVTKVVLQAGIGH